MSAKEQSELSFSRRLYRLAAVLATVIAIGPPATYFTLWYQFENSDALVASKLYAAFITQVIRADAGWRDNALDLIAEDLTKDELPETRRIVAADGGEIARTDGQVPPPVLSRATDLFDAAGQPAGKIEVSRSLRPIVRQTAIVAVACVAVAAGVFLLLFALPISALKRAWTALATEKRLAQESEERLRVVIDNASEGIVTVATDGKVLGFSSAAEDIFGYVAAEVVGRDVATLLPDMRIERLERLETTGRRRDGGDVPIELSGSEVHLAGARQFVYMVRDITERKQAEARLLHLANFDGLTDLPNRNLFNDRLAHAIVRADRDQSLVALLFLDLDRFKTVNDTLGHNTGDRLLREVGRVLQGSLRKSDTVARIAAGEAEELADQAIISRLGGDEFTIILEGIAKVDAVAHVCQKIIDAFQKPIALDRQELYISTSIGVALYPVDDTDQESLIKHADAAMYRAKELGRGTYHFYTRDLNARIGDRLKLEADLHKAIDHDEFVLHYQPKIDIGKGEVVGVEALLRWHHDGRMISPADFIPILEETGLIIAVGDWVLKTACAQVKAWQAQGLQPIRVAVNLSSRQFQKADLVQGVARILDETALPPDFLELELTESMLMANTEHNIAVMAELGGIGVQLSIDDFGTGYSSLSYLKRFAIDVLKIDRSFVRDIVHDPDDAAIASAVIALANSLRLKVVAEGVETEEQLRVLHGLGCHQIQGYLLGRPMPADALASYLAGSPCAKLPLMLGERRTPDA